MQNHKENVGKSKAKKASATIARYSRWVRLYAEVREDPKILLLSHHQRWNWIVLLTLAGDAPDGRLPAISHIAIVLRCSIADAQLFINELIEAGLVNCEYTGSELTGLKMHNWEARQFKSDSSTERSRKHRAKTKLSTAQRKCNVAATEMQRPRSVYVSVSESVDTGLSYQEGKTGSEEDRYGDTHSKISVGARHAHRTTRGRS